MRFDLKDIVILLLCQSKQDAKLLAAGLNTFHIKKIEAASDAEAAFKIYQKKKIDLIISDIWDGEHDGIALNLKIREYDKNNTATRILALAGIKELFLAEKIRNAGISDLLMRPYSVDDLVYKINHILNHDPKVLEKENNEYAKNNTGETEKTPKNWPKEEASKTVTHVLLDSYTKQHEIILSKLQIAKTATSRSIDEIRKTHDKVKSLDNQTISKFNDFDQMWNDIIDLFMNSGVSEEALDQIDDIIAKMPKDIKSHYQDLTQQDKSFLTLVESLNKEAYTKARKKVAKLQEQPNPLNGKSALDYKGGQSKPDDKKDQDKTDSSVSKYFFHTRV